jgi:hypothetical protein
MRGSTGEAAGVKTTGQFVAAGNDYGELFIKQLALPDAIDAVVKPDPDRKKPSLHARISFTFHNEGDREQHYSLRLPGHTNAIAFQSRLKAAMTASGIDRALKFRHLFILRRGGRLVGRQQEHSLINSLKLAANSLRLEMMICAFSAHCKRCRNAISQTSKLGCGRGNRCPRRSCSTLRASVRGRSCCPLRQVSREERRPPPKR